MIGLHRRSHLSSAALLVLLIALLLAPGAAPQPAHAQAGGYPFLPVTLDHMGPLLSGGGFFSPLAASADWVLYAKGLYGCGHCRASLDTLYLRDVANGESYTVRAATLTDAGGFDSTAGAQGLQFVAPYVVWGQPGSKASGMPDSQFIKGDFDCSICYFNVATGQGGPVSGLQALEANEAGGILPLALDGGGSGRIMAAVDDASGERLYLGSVSGTDVKQLPLRDNAQAGDVSGAAIYGDVIAWAARTPADKWDLLTYREAAGQIDPAGEFDNPVKPQANGEFLFWPGPNNRVQSENWETRELDVVSLPPGVSQFFIWSHYVAYVQYADSPGIATLHVADAEQYTGAFMETPLTPRLQPGDTGDMSLRAFGGGKLLFLTNEFSPAYQGPPIEQRVEMAALVQPNAAFQQVWSKADEAVASGKVARSWLWGPTPRYIGQEAYQQGPDGQHQVLYYDKARMEVNNPSGDPNNPFYVSNGLLVVEMMSGQIQTGDNTFAPAPNGPATLTVAGDTRKLNPLTPDYATFAEVASLHGDNQAPDRTGQPVADAIDVTGALSADPAHAGLDKYAMYVAATGHNITGLFLGYLQSMAPDYGFDWTYAVGLPITEAYWTQMRVGGKDYAVLMQAFQRRVLTYTPDFAPPWQIQQGNVGEHYLNWRYGATVQN